MHRSGDVAGEIAQGNTSPPRPLSEKIVSPGGADVQQEPWGVDYGRLTPRLVRAIQQLAGRLKQLEDLNDAHASVRRRVG